MTERLRRIDWLKHLSRPPMHVLVMLIPYGVVWLLGWDTAMYTIGFVAASVYWFYDDWLWRKLRQRVQR